MAPVKFSRVISVSSEDPRYPATNLLSSESKKCWKCKDPSEKQVAVILQLEESCTIQSIDIGNENSAFVEIFVSKSVNPDVHEILRVASALMSVQDAKADRNKNSVRFFKSDEFNQPVASQSWDRIKVVCTQPFNKIVQYGLSFIKVHPKTENTSETKTNSILGKFTLKADTDDESISVGSFFAKRKDPEPVTAATAIKAAAADPSGSAFGKLSAKKRLSDILPKKDAKKPRTNGDLTDTPTSSSSRKATKGPLLYAGSESDDDEKKAKSPQSAKKETKISSNTKSPRVEKKEAITPNNKQVTRALPPKTTESPKGPTNAEASTYKKQRNTGDQPKEKRKKEDGPKRKPFNRLLEGVTFAISGYQNPYRSDLRSKALKMGAKYRADWDRSCSHLICAFSNTPKFNQVLGKGWIVRKDWIEDCYNLRKRLLSSKYKLDQNDPYKNTTDEEIWEEIAKPEESNDSDSVEDEGTPSPQSNEAVPSTSKANTSNKPSVYDVDTDIDSDSASPDSSRRENLTLKVLPDFFHKKTFYLGVDLLNSIVVLLKRYIIAYKGEPLDDVDSVNYIISEDARYKDNINGIPVVFPAWIWECNDKKQLIPLDSYLV